MARWIKVNIDQYKLVANYCRNDDKHGGSCIFILNELKFKELPSVTNLGREKLFEISAVELIDLKIIVVCIYSSPICNVDSFLELLRDNCK